MNVKYPTNSAPGGTVKMSWFEYSQKNKPQGNSVAGGIIIMFVSGLHIAYGIFNIYTSTKYNLSVLQSSWYVGVILASIVANFLIDKWEKKLFYYIGAASCALGSCMFFEPMSNTEEVLIFGRFLAGIGHGLVYMPLVIHSGENSVKELRGMLLSSINFSVMISVATASIFNLMINSISSTEIIIDPKLFLAILSLIYSAMAFILIPMMFYESPVFLIRNNRDSEALANMIKLRSEQSESWQVRTEFEDLRQLIVEDKQTNTNIFDENNLRPLMIVTLAKLLNTLSFNYALNLIRLFYVTIGFVFSSNNVMFWIPLATIFTRTIIGMMPMFGMDRIGRKKIMTVSASLCGIMIVILGIVLKASDGLNVSTFLIVSFILFDIFSSFGIGMVPDVLASEAFPVPKKAQSITFASIIDTIFNLIIIIVTQHAWGETFILFVLFGFGAMLILGAGFFYFNVPETKMMSLRESRDVLRGTITQQATQAHYNI